MSVTETGWGEVERRAKVHEMSINQIHTATINEVLAKAGLPLVHISIEDRKNGAIMEAMAQIKRGDSLGAWNTLQEGLKL